ncbi:MAG: RrF2 family transcriptional regulator [Candidatus Brocadiia bacterium]
MQFSTKMRYGSRALAELAAAHPEGTVPVRELAEKQDISAKYLEQIMSRLKAAGIVEAVRGLHGGYRLAGPPGECRLSEVFAALEGSPAPVACVDEPGECPLEGCCPTRATWSEVKDAILEVLEDTTLRELAERIKEKRARREAPMYYI